MPMNVSTSNPARRRLSERGQAIIFVVFSIIGLFGLAALAIDGGSAFVDRRNAENAAAAAALTAAVTRIEGGNWRAAALAAARANGYDNNGVTNTVEMNTPPLSGPFAGNAEYIEVIITSHFRTYFGPVIGVPQITSVARAIAQSKPAEIGPMFEGYALVSLAPHSRCDKQRGFWIHGEATIVLEGGGLFVNSDNPDCALIQQGSGSIRIDDESPITVVGGAQIQKPRLITPYPFQTGAPPIPYPPAFEMPKVGCGSKMAEVDQESGTMSPGAWHEDIFPPEGVHHLEGGVYCIGGDFILDGGQSLSGSRVVLVIEGSVRISGDANVDLSAPMQGAYKGLLIYMPLGNKNVLALNGDTRSSYRGTILAPSADVRINGLDAVHGAAYHSQIIGYYIEVDGQSLIRIKYKEEQNYKVITMPEVILVK